MAGAKTQLGSSETIVIAALAWCCYITNASMSVSCPFLASKLLICSKNVLY